MNIVEKRADGFHNIETVFYPIAWCDVLEAVENTRFSKGEEKVHLSLSGLEVAGNSQDNLLIKTYTLLDEMYSLPPLLMHIHKAIPMGAGLGGGSANAAFFIKMMNEKFSLNIAIHQQKKIAAQLGSDCAFFIDNKAVFAQNTGSVFSESDVRLAHYYAVVVYPNVHSNTAKAYQNCTPAVPTKRIPHILKQDSGTWKNELNNDFESILFAQYPQIKKTKETLYLHGAVYAAMSGSGSAVFGLFKKEVDTTALNFDSQYLVWQGKLF